MLQKLSILYYLFLFHVQRIKNRTQLSKWRSSRLEKLESFLSKNSKYYAAKITENGGLLHIPIINKQTYFENFDQINTANINYSEAMNLALKAEESRDFTPTIGPVAVGLSSGTTGNRGLFITNDRERNHWVAAMIYKMIGFKLRKRKIAFFLRSNNQLYENSNSGLIQFTYFDLSLPFEKLLIHLNELKPNILIAQPSVLRAISDAQTTSTIQINPEKIISVAEVLEDDVKAHISRTFNQIVHQIYQCTEGFLACTCLHGNLHMNEDIIFFQERWLDEEKTRFHPIITDLYRRTQPMVRYELNDVLTYDSKECECGSPFRVIKNIEGRQDDVLIFVRRSTAEYKLVFGDFIRKIILISDCNNQILNYQIHQEYELELIVSLDLDNFDSNDDLERQIVDGFSLWCNQNDLQIPVILFKNGVKFDPMKKFRRITRFPFNYPEKTTYL